MFLARVLLLLIVLSLGTWLMLSGLQQLISATPLFGFGQILLLILGFVCFFGGIAGGVLVLSPSTYK